jgi:hypothetical protein
MTLEERVKALEDQWQRLAEVFLAAPAPKQKEEVNPLKNEIAKPAVMSTLKWESMPPTGKGPWEKTDDTSSQEAKEILANFTSTKNTVFKDGYVYWPLRKDGKLEGLGRRKAA